MGFARPKVPPPFPLPSIDTGWFTQQQSITALEATGFKFKAVESHVLAHSQLSGGVGELSEGISVTWA